MRLGGARKSAETGVLARRVVATVVVIAGGFAAGAGASAGAAEAAKATKGTWAVTRDAEGGVHVVRGLEAAVAAMDDQLGRQLGRSADQVLTSEQDSTVHVLAT